MVRYRKMLDYSSVWSVLLMDDRPLEHKSSQAFPSETKQ